MRESIRVSTTYWLSTLALAGLVACFTAIQIHARSGPEISGPARIVDGDTIEILGTRVRLEGIDAPEADQNCNGGHAGNWRCGAEATKFLADLIAQREVRCSSLGTDRFDRMLGQCYVAEHDINETMVRQGLAWAFKKYSTTYVGAERDARAHRRGIWRADTQPAWAYRAERGDLAANATPKGCNIKGNISRGQRIYHLPWSPYYTQTRIDPEHGERWFCSEAEAIEAGWRPARTF